MTIRKHDEDRDALVSDIESALHEHARKMAWLAGYQAPDQIQGKTYRVTSANHALQAFDEYWEKPI